MGWAWADHDDNASGSNGHNHDSRGYDAGGATNGTNQIGELCAVLQALRAHPGSEPLVIETDSQYAINCSSTWVKGWKKNGWKNSQKKPVKNVELIKAIDAEITKRAGDVSFVWVKGHAGNQGNELVDELARTYADDCRSGARDGYLPIEGWQSLLNSEYGAGTQVPPDVQLQLGNTAAPMTLDFGEPEAAEPVEVTPTVQTAPSTNELAQPAQPTQPTQSTGANLWVSGTLTFSPAPQESPSFTGKPMPIHTTIEIDGEVNGDGTLTITNVPVVRG